MAVPEATFFTTAKALSLEVFGRSGTKYEFSKNSAKRVLDAGDIEMFRHHAGLEECDEKGIPLAQDAPGPSKQAKPQSYTKITQGEDGSLRSTDFPKRR